MVDLTVYGRWRLLPVRRQLPCIDGFAWLGSHPILVNRTGASLKVVVVAGFKNCSSTLFWSFGPFEPRSLQQRWLRKNYIFGTATSYHGLKAVLSKEFAEHENEAVKL